MALSIAQIAAKALNAVQGAISDAVPAATLTRQTAVSYDAANDVTEVTTTTQDCRVVFANEAAKPGQFGAYVVGPGDEVLMIEGATGVPINDTVTVGSRVLTIMAVQDIAGAGTVFMVVAR